MMASDTFTLQFLAEARRVIDRLDADSIE